jgi:hypothetical protein
VLVGEVERWRWRDDGKAPPNTTELLGENKRKERWAAKEILEMTATGKQKEAELRCKRRRRQRGTHTSQPEDVDGVWVQDFGNEDAAEKRRKGTEGEKASGSGRDTS